MHAKLFPQLRASAVLSWWHRVGVSRQKLGLEWPLQETYAYGPRTVLVDAVSAVSEVSDA